MDFTKILINILLELKKAERISKFKEEDPRYKIEKICGEKSWRRPIYTTISSKVYKDNYLKQRVCLDEENVKFITIDAFRTRTSEKSGSK